MRVLDLVKKIDKDEVKEFTQLFQRNTVNIMESTWFNKKQT